MVFAKITMISSLKQILICFKYTKYIKEVINKRPWKPLRLDGTLQQNCIMFRILFEFSFQERNFALLSEIRKKMILDINCPMCAIRKNRQNAFFYIQSISPLFHTHKKRLNPLMIIILPLFVLLLNTYHHQTIIRKKNRS